jgi:hypothetical protein
MPDKGHNVVREGMYAGVIGATLVAIWFLIVDTVAGRPFFTPGVLGDALLSVLDPKLPPENNFVNVVAYTVFHYGAFMVGGLIVSIVVNVAETRPSVLAGFLIIFVAFEIGFHGMVALLQETTVLRNLAWYQVMIGNVIAAIGMGAYLWRLHPQLGSELAHALDGTGE